MVKGRMQMLKRIIIAGIPAGFFLALIGAITESSSLAVFMSNIALNAKDWMVSVLFYNFMVGLILVLIYNAIHKGLEGNNPVTKGLFFGIIIWMIQTLPNVISSFLHNPQVVDFIKLELTTGFVAYPLVGIIIAVTFKRYIEA
ncbi:MAG: hypothetical protein DKM50_04010 [Candidatus Margulisiibacteriota bacterium]|nr:MAG: hypothetical protein A2X43_01725 [Candidatus Margulisbacteria bacterium GWD2_39_127]OGI05497.1 MAG: hypothetical protein A2X42_00110 [Candidatus Margulisbacteria bacterium GWF2_38_17]PZM82301.1 MAG: hypothetical protein DKM50_04010 [Candidatus Margulisiibacteriota bacterium]HAR62953.1 hypothetical protein [Candidatus Margulisiibacteriota bacterium]HCY37010.1 hypothetical protein [Candidatus Margulisiibacteriota bacterium]